jgi:hypothetical protein
MRGEGCWKMKKQIIKVTLSLNNELLYLIQLQKWDYAGYLRFC